jgi:thiol-disulfide isomerase/thioredoxin
MARPSAHFVLIAGILSPVAAALFGIQVYTRLTRASANPDQDFVFRLSLTTLAMVVPFAATLVLAIRERRRHHSTTSSKIGLALAVLSLALTWLPVRGLMDRTRQARSLSRQNVPAPPFDTVDLLGKPHRLDDHAGKVVLVNAWASWCGPCRREMPSLDRLYRERKDQGFMVFGVSTEDVEVQRKFVEERVSVSYPLLTLQGDVPGMYRNIASYPATFLIDRQGRLQPAPSSEQPFEQLEAAVEALLQGAPASKP